MAQLDAIVEFIALDKPEAAKAVAVRVFGATDHLESFVRLGREIPEFPHRNYRQVWIKPCWLYYRIDGKQVFVLHVRRVEKPFSLKDLLQADV